MQQRPGPGQGRGVGGEKEADSRVIKEIDSTGFGEEQPRWSEQEEVSVMVKLPPGMSVLDEGSGER